jgi:hypothetical protein
VRESPIFIKSFETLEWILAHTRKFPRHQRFVMAKRIEEAALSFHDQLVLATKGATAIRTRVWQSPAQGDGQVWNGELKHASVSDQTKSRRIQSAPGNGFGRPTGFDVRRTMPSVPLALIDDTAWQLMHEA